MHDQSRACVARTINEITLTTLGARRQCRIRTLLQASALDHRNRLALPAAYLIDVTSYRARSKMKHQLDQLLVQLSLNVKQCCCCYGRWWHEMSNVDFSCMSHDGGRNNNATPSSTLTAVTDRSLPRIHNQAKPLSNCSSNVNSTNKFQLSAHAWSLATWVVTVVTSQDADCAEIGILFVRRRHAAVLVRRSHTSTNTSRTSCIIHTLCVRRCVLRWRRIV